MQENKTSGKGISLEFLKTTSAIGPDKVWKDAIKKEETFGKLKGNQLEKDKIDTQNAIKKA